MTVTIPEQAVEAAARKLCPIDPNSDTEWKHGGKWYRPGIPHWKSWTEEARIALEAALPHLTAALPLMGVQQTEWWHDHIRCPGCNASPANFCINGCMLQDCPMGRALAEAEPPIDALPAQSGSGVRENVARAREPALCEAPPSVADAVLADQVFEIARRCNGDYNYPAAEVLGKVVARLRYLSSLPHTGQPVEGWRGVLGERLASFISERDPFGDYFSAHDIEQLEKACARIADTRKTMWLVERDGLYTEYRNAGMPNWVTDPWRAAEYESFEDAEYARKRIELDEWRDRSKSVEHIFVNRPKPVDPPKPIYFEASFSPAPASPQPREEEK